MPSNKTISEVETQQFHAITDGEMVTQLFRNIFKVTPEVESVLQRMEVQINLLSDNQFKAGQQQTLEWVEKVLEEQKITQEEINALYEQGFGADAHGCEKDNDLIDGLISELKQRTNTK